MLIRAKRISLRYYQLALLAFKPYNHALGWAWPIHCFAILQHPVHNCSHTYCQVTGTHLDKAVLGYGNLTEEAIKEGVRRMADVLADPAMDSIVSLNWRLWYHIC